MKSAQNLIWLDMEMTGLDPATDRILEIATVVTDKHLTILAHGPVLAIWQPETVLANMDAWNTKHHTQSGLKKRVIESQISEPDAAEQTLAFLHQWVPAGKSPMCGNTISQDRRFMARYMPKLEQYFHYRHIDVSTIKELAKRWAPQIATSFKKSGKHQALDDILESIAEMHHYREQFFNVSHPNPSESI
jgi:oligoribonuclease